MKDNALVDALEIGWKSQLVGKEVGRAVLVAGTPEGYAWTPKQSQAIYQRIRQVFSDTNKQQYGNRLVGFTFTVKAVKTRINDIEDIPEIEKPDIHVQPSTPVASNSPKARAGATTKDARQARRRKKRKGFR